MQVVDVFENISAIDEADQPARQHFAQTVIDVLFQS
jgi:hypothetical protein